MTNREALLETIWRNPNDPTPRIVYADWLEENATEQKHLKQAEFIRVATKNDGDKPRQWLYGNWRLLLVSFDEAISNGELAARGEGWWKCGIRYAPLTMVSLKIKLHPRAWMNHGNWIAVRFWSGFLVQCEAVRTGWGADEYMQSTLLDLIREDSPQFGLPDMSKLVTA